MAKIWIITRKYLWLNLFHILLSSVYLGVILNGFYTLLGSVYLRVIFNSLLLCLAELNESN